MKLGTQNEVPASRCPACGQINDMATSVGADAKPEPGDATICIRCGHIAVFADDLALRNPSDEEIVRFAGDERLLAVQRARAMVERDRAYIEDAIREGADKAGMRLTHAHVNDLVDQAFALIPRPPRKAR